MSDQTRRGFFGLLAALGSPFSLYWLRHGSRQASLTTIKSADLMRVRDEMAKHLRDEMSRFKEVTPNEIRAMRGRPPCPPDDLPGGQPTPCYGADQE
jgi:hypothetical protein